MSSTKYVISATFSVIFEQGKTIIIMDVEFYLGNTFSRGRDGEMIKYSSKSRISMPVHMPTMLTCLVILLFWGSISFVSHASDKVYYTHVIFTAPSAEKIFDGTPLTEQIDVTVQGLPEGYTYKAVAEGSVTYPEDNKENNNIVTDYMIFDPSGLNVTENFKNIELRPGTLRVSYADSSVMGAKRGETYTNKELREEDKKNNISLYEKEEITDIEDEDTAKAGVLPTTVKKNREITYIEVMVYVALSVILFAVFAVFVSDSKKMRE